MTIVGSRGGLLAGLALLAIVSQFLRSSIGVIAPDLVEDLSLSAETLGLAGGVFFLAMGIAQIPVGMSFDRIGARMTVAWISVFALAGCALMATAESATALIAGRFLAGFGCGASFMSSVVMLMRWYPPERMGTMYGRIFAVSQLGNFAAATPMAWMTGQFGWRAVFAGTAILAMLVTAFFVWTGRDQPPGQAPMRSHGESLWQALGGFARVLKVPGYPRVIAVHMVAYATMATLLGLWAGPYLHDVHGMDGVARGNVLLAMSTAQVAGMLGLVPLERRLNTRKGVILGAASIVFAILVALAAMPAPPAWLAIALLVLLCGVSTYNAIIIAHAANLTPRELQGRGSTAANIGQVTGSFLLPVLTGAIAGLFERGVDGLPPDAYRVIFGFMACTLAAGALVYSRVADLKPVAQAPGAPGPAQNTPG